MEYKLKLVSHPGSLMREEWSTVLSPIGERGREILHSTSTERKPQDLISHHHGYITETAQQQESLFGFKCGDIMY